MNPQIRLGFLLLLFLPAGSFAGCSALGPSRPDVGTPPLPLKLAGITVEPLLLGGSASPPGGETFIRLLETAATDQAARSLVLRGVAGDVERAQPGATRLAGQSTLLGSVSMVVALPENIRGLTAARRKGTLATARVQLMGADGNVVAAGEANVAWHDVRWLEGARYRHSRPIGEVLLEGVRLSVDRAVEDLRRLPR